MVTPVLGAASASESPGDHLRGAEYAGQDRRGNHRTAHAEQPTRRPGPRTEHAEPWPNDAADRLRARGAETRATACRLPAPEKADEGQAHAPGVQRHRHGGTDDREDEVGAGQRRCVAPIDAIALVITPDGEQHVGHHHHQCRTLRQLLIQPEQHTQYRDRDQPAADAEQSAKRAQGQAQQYVQPDVQQHVRAPASMRRPCYAAAAGVDTHSRAQWLLPITHKPVTRCCQTPFRSARTLHRRARMRQLFAAARRHGLTPSAVARRIDALEAALGCQLFSRSTHAVRAMPAALAFAERARRIVQELHRPCRGDILDSAPEGRIRIDAPAPFGRRHLAPALAEFLQAYPGVDIQLRLIDSFVDLHGEHLGEVDLVLRIGPLADTRGRHAPGADGAHRLRQPGLPSVAACR